MSQVSMTEKALPRAYSPASNAPSSRLTSAGGLEVASPESTLLINLVALYIFLLVSRVLDLSPIWWMRIPLILLIVLVGFTVAKGNFRVAFKSKITITFGLFTFWVALTVPFSKWRFASMDPLQSQVEAFVIFVIIIQAARTPSAYRRVAGSYAYATLVASIMSFYLGRSVENGRLALAGGLLGDPNQFALALVVGLPFWWDKASSAKGFRKVYCLMCTVPLLIAFGKTGSRSGLIALVALVLVTFLFASGAKKLLIAGGCIALMAGSTFLLPEYIRDRFQTVFQPANDTSLDKKDAAHLGSDIASSEARKALLMQSIQMTIENPLFGVGPGVFSYASWDQRKSASGVGGLAQVTHNTYTQVSSETGIPGFLLFLATMIMVLKSAYASYRSLKESDAVTAQSGRYLFSVIAAFAVGIFFLSVGYSHIVSVLFALVVALGNVTEKLASEAALRVRSIAPVGISPSIVQPKAQVAAPKSEPVRAALANSKALRAAGLPSLKKTFRSLHK